MEHVISLNMDSSYMQADTITDPSQGGQLPPSAQAPSLLPPLFKVSKLIDIFPSIVDGSFYHVGVARQVVRRTRYCRLR